MLLFCRTETPSIIIVVAVASLTLANGKAANIANVSIAPI